MCKFINWTFVETDVKVGTDADDGLRHTAQYSGKKAILILAAVRM
jgi:hypothetical protein